MESALIYYFPLVLVGGIYIAFHTKIFRFLFNSDQKLDHVNDVFLVIRPSEND